VEVSLSFPPSIPGLIGGFGCRGEGGIASEWRTISGIQRELRTGRPGKPRARELDDDDDDDDGNGDGDGDGDDGDDYDEEDEDDSLRFSHGIDRPPTPGSA